MFLAGGVGVGVWPARHCHPGLVSRSVDFGLCVYALRVHVWIHHISEAVWVRDCRLIHVPAHSNQPTPEVVKAVIRSTTVDGVSRSPKIDRVCPRRKTIKDVVPFDDLGWLE